MNAVVVIFNIILVVLVLYLMLIWIRVFATWFRFGGSISLLEFLARITDPYINLFAKWRIARIGNMSLAPAIATIFLWLAIQICAQIVAYHAVSVAIILAVFLQMIGSTIGWIGIFFAIVGAARFIGGFFRPNAALARIWTALDHLITPMIYPLVSRVIPNRVVSYQVILVIFVVLWVLVYIIANLIFGLLANLALMLPF